MSGIADNIATKKAESAAALSAFYILTRVNDQHPLTTGYLEKLPFCPITALGSNFNPQNTKCIPAVKIFVCLVLEQKF